MGRGGGGGGYSEIFIHFLFKILKFDIFFYIFLGGGRGGWSEKKNSFGGMKKLWIFLGDH